MAWPTGASVRFVLALLGAGATTSCGEAVSLEPAGPAILELAVEATDQPHVRVLRLRLDRDAAAEVEYWTEGAERLAVSSPAATEHRIPLPRLRAGSPYQIEAWAVAPGEPRGEPRRGSVTTDPLPADLAGIRFSATGTPSHPLTLLVVHNAAVQGFTGLVIVDGDGEVVWHLRVDGPTGVARRENGNFALVSNLGLAEVSPAGAWVAEVPTDPEGRRFHHDIIATPGNTLLAIATDTQTVDGTRFTGEAVWEWTPETGDLHRRWTAFDALDPVSDRGPRFSEDNWLHANSLWLGSRGNVLLSSNYLNQVLSIAPGFDALEWRLGGTNATIAVSDEERFSGQHTAAEVADGRVLLFDNRREQGGYSRAVEFELDGDVARRVWEWRPARDNFASIVSSARRLPDGGALVAFGTSAGLVESSGPIEVYEVSREGAIRWHLEVADLFALYRAEPLADLAGEVAVSAP